VSTSSECYPSWLPKRPPPPAPGSTSHSLSTAMMFVSAGAASASEDRQQQTPVPFSGGCKPTPRFRSHRQHAGLGCWWSSGRGSSQGQIGRRQRG
jgi:hypothetical protein